MSRRWRRQAASDRVFPGLLVSSGWVLVGTGVSGAAALLATALNSAIQGALNGLEAFREFAMAQWIQGVGSGAGLLAGASAGGAMGAMIGFSIGQWLAAACSLELLRRNSRAQSVTVVY